MMKHDDFAVSNIPAGDQTVYIAGAKVVALYPFGPLWALRRTAASWGTTTGRTSGSTLMRSRAGSGHARRVHP